MLYICSRIIIINLFKIIITMFGKPSGGAAARPIPGTYMCQLYKIAHLGLIRGGNYSSYSNQVVFAFQTIAKIDEEKDESGKVSYKLNFKDASSMFKEEKGLQPWNIACKLFGDDKPLDFFQKLVKRPLTELELIEGFNAIETIGRTFTVVIADSKPNAAGKVYTDIADVVKPTTTEKAAKAMDMARAGGVTFNTETLFHVTYNAKTQERIETCAAIITQPEWSRLMRSERKLVASSYEVAQMPDSEIMGQFKE